MASVGKEEVFAGDRQERRLQTSSQQGQVERMAFVILTESLGSAAFIAYFQLSGSQKLLFK